MRFPSFCVEIVFWNTRLLWFAAPLTKQVQMPVLIFTMYRRDGLRSSAWIGLN